MKLLDIEEIRDKSPIRYPGARSRRCACARAMIHRPKLILADEPTGALDSRAAQMLLETFRKMNHDMHSTILMVTHDAFSASYCSRILFLKDGKIFHELVRGVEERREFLNKILDVLSLTGGDCQMFGKLALRNGQAFRQRLSGVVLTMTFVVSLMFAFNSTFFRRIFRKCMKWQR